MSTDRELLELAAKAAGLEYNGLWFDEHTGLLVWEPPTNYESRGWNPLTDDGDALRLAVALKIAVDFDGIEQGCAQAMSNNSGHWEVEPCAEETRSSATRRAIVRAAAELGRKS